MFIERPEDPGDGRGWSVRMNPLRREPQASIDAADPVLERWFATHARLPAADDAALARGRRLVATRLAAPQPATAGRSVLRRLTWAGLGGGGLWASMVGAAAAHPLVGAVTALALVAGGAAAAEVSGVGPAVRETVGIQSRTVEDATPAVSATVDAANAGPTSTSTAVTAASGLTAVEAAPEGQPGNLVTQLHNGRFVLRAQLEGIDEESVSLLTADGFVTLALADEGEVQVPGASKHDAELEAAAGQLVTATGGCEPGVEALGPGCTVERIHVLRAPPETPTAPAGSGAASADDQPHAKPDHHDDDASKDEHSKDGRPDFRRSQEDGSHGWYPGWSKLPDQSDRWDGPDGPISDDQD